VRRYPNVPVVAIERKVAAVERHRAKQVGVKGHELSDLFVSLMTENIWSVVPLTEEWRVAYRLVVQGGALRIGEIRIYPRETYAIAPHIKQAAGEWSGGIVGYRASVPEGGMPANLVHSLTVGAHLAEAQRVVAWAPAEAKLARKQGLQRHDPFSQEGLWGQLGIRPPERLTTAPVRRAAVLRRYARAADAYVAALGRHERAPLHSVARSFDIEYSAARDLIHQARVQGLLLPQSARRGRPEGYLSKAAIDILSRTGRPKTRKEN
jgi:hypothetical protein